MTRRATLLGAALLACLALARPGRGVTPEPISAAPAASASALASCPLSGTTVRPSDRQPVSGVIVMLVIGGQSATTDGTGRWSLDPGDASRATLRVTSPVPVSFFFSQRVRTADGDIFQGLRLPAGTVEISLAMTQTCQILIEDVRQVTRTEGPVARPAPPPLPAGFTPSDATRAAAFPGASDGNAGNVPWLGYFWLTAPEIPVGVCGITDAATLTAAETAVQRWIDAAQRGLGWRIVRTDAACDSGFTQPRLLIKRELVDEDDNVLGETPALDLSGQECDVDLRGTTCWISTATVRLNPPGFDRLSDDQRVATVLHEMGHAFGLAHTRGCGDSIMWYNTRCDFAPTLFPGADDIASLNELLTVTLRALQSQ